jgi:hypothetical protein
MERAMTANKLASATGNSEWHPRSGQARVRWSELQPQFLLEELGR